MNKLLKKLGYADEDVKKIIDGMKDEKLYISKEENIDERYSKLKEQKQEADSQLAKAQSTIDDLQKSNANNEELQSKISEYESEIAKIKESSEAKIKDMAFSTAISGVLSKSGAKHEDLLAAKFDKTKLAMDDKGNVTGIDEQVKALKEQYADLFGSTLGGVPPATGGTASEPDSYAALVESADDMTAEQIAERFSKLK